MSSAYFLAQNPKNHIEIVEKGQKAYDPKEHVASPFLFPNYDSCMTNLPIFRAIRGIFKADTANSIFVQDSLK